VVAGVSATVAALFLGLTYQNRARGKLLVPPGTFVVQRSRLRDAPDGVFTVTFIKENTPLG
jgi:hypothetical protein